MTIKELCNETPRCVYCSFQAICPYNISDMDKPLSDLNDKQNEQITAAIIRTARRLQEDNND